MLPAEINKENKLCASIITQHHTLIKCKIFAATGKWIDWLYFEWLDCSAHLNQVQSAIFVILYGSQKYEMYKDHKSCILRDDNIGVRRRPVRKLFCWFQWFDGEGWCMMIDRGGRGGCVPSPWMPDFVSFDCITSRKESLEGSFHHFWFSANSTAGVTVIWTLPVETHVTSCSQEQTSQSTDSTSCRHIMQTCCTCTSFLCYCSKNSHVMDPFAS